MFVVLVCQLVEGDDAHAAADHHSSGNYKV